MGTRAGLWIDHRKAIIGLCCKNREPIGNSRRMSGIRLPTGIAVGERIRDIARRLGRIPSSISDETRRNKMVDDIIPSVRLMKGMKELQEIFTPKEI